MFTCHSLSWLVTLCLNSGQESGVTQVREQEACQGYLQVLCTSDGEYENIKCHRLGTKGIV